MGADKGQQEKTSSPGMNSEGALRLRGGGAETSPRKILESMPINGLEL